MKSPKLRFASFLLFLCLIINIFSMASCSILTNHDPDIDVDVSLPDESENTSDSTEDVVLTSPPDETLAIIHMIQPVNELKGWQSGRTQHSARYYVDDMMDIFDSLDWKGQDSIAISGDFDFRINLNRPLSELDAYHAFFDHNESDTVADSSKEDTADTAAPSAETDSSNGLFDSDKLISVQYLINYEDRIVNMRLSDYAAQTFDIYAELDESEIKMLILCLKYYFGPVQ